MVSFKKKVEQSYDRTSNKYDDIMKYDIKRKKIRPNYNQLFTQYTAKENPTILDIGCGTGISTFELAKIFDMKGTFHGIDISEKMIQKANETAISQGFDDFRFCKGDAENLDYHDFVFDIVSSCYTFHFIPDKKKAVEEMYRVTKSGGEVGVLFHGLYHINEVLSLLGDLGSKYPEYLGDIDWSDVMGKFICLEEVFDLFSSVGFDIVSLYGVHEVAFVNPSMFMRGLDTVFSFWQEGLSSNVVVRLRDELVQGMVSKSTDKGFKRTRYDIYAHGKKP
jgi:ubiquinone/menaquinone biosynthesis C-methylase UbiE